MEKILNNLTVAGRIGKDAVLRFTGEGKPVAGFNVACDVGYGDNKRTLWFSCSLWGKRAESLAEYLTKGTQVTVIGEMSTREHEGKTYLQLRVNDIALQGGVNNPAGNNQAQPAPPADNFEDDSIPF